MPKSRIFTAIDLFSGCGGLTLGLKRAGFRVLGAVDNDSLSVETYKKNHSEVCIWHQDIRYLSVEIVKKTLKLKKGQLDLLAGCPPCQGFSTMRTLNRNKSIDDPRNSLIFEFLRIVEELRPKTIMFENVPGLAKDLSFSLFQNLLEDMGYICNIDTLDAADYGVPQRRKRLILLAGKKRKIHFAGESKRNPTVRDALGNMSLPSQSKDSLHNILEKRTHCITELIKLIPKNGGSRRDLGDGYQLPCHKKCDGFKDVYGRMEWDKPAPTITSGCTNPSKGRFLHPTQNRAITLREAALIQSFPRRYYFSMSKGKQGVADMIGNALPPIFVERHGLSISNYLKEYE